ncbi:MAG: hypothetical protein SF051_15500 [Elusimicrobiota bacterium]|nr:hypothetical protein [Elusimicrobiota bacterium]
MMRLLLSLLLLAPAVDAAAPVRVVPRLTPTLIGVTVVPPPVASARLLSADSLLSAPALAPRPVLVPAAPLPAAVLPARTVLAVRADADRLYAALAEVHSREKAGEPQSSLADLKRALLGEFDGALAGLPAMESGADLRARVKTLRRERAAAVKAVDAAPAARRAEASTRLARVSGALAVAQLKTGREMLSDAAPVGPKALRRNAALWSLVGAHNSASVAAAEAGYLEALSRGEEAFGDGRPFVVTSRWRQLHSELDEAARHARNGRPAEAAALLRTAAAALRAAGRDAADARAASALERLAAAPASAAILSAKDLVRHPTLKTVQPVSYEDLGAALRAQAHALESGRADYLETAAHEASLRRAEALLASRRPTKAERAEAGRLLAAASAWSARGRVEAKRLTAANAAAAERATANGDLALAARHAGWAADALAERREELLRIGLSLKRRLLRSLGA